MTRINLESFHRTSRGMVVPTTEKTVAGVTVTLVRQFVPIGGGLAVAPVVEAVENGVLIRLDQWMAMSVRADEGGLLPLTIPSQDQAARAARDFDRDPGIAWTSPAAEVSAWCLRWAEQQNGGERP